MKKQMALRFTQDTATEALWETIPDEHRREMIKLYARLIAIAARAESHSVPTEKDHEQTDQ
jgi:hypothetical protein